MLAVEPVLLTRVEAAEFLGISLSTLDQWTRTDGPRMGLIRKGRIVRYVRDTLDAYAHQLGTPPED